MHHLNWQNRVPGKVKGKQPFVFTKDSMGWVDRDNISVFQTSCLENSIYVEIESRHDQLGFMNLSNHLTLLRKSVKIIDFRQSSFFYKTLKQGRLEYPSRRRMWRNHGIIRFEFTIYTISEEGFQTGMLFYRQSRIRIGY